MRKLVWLTWTTTLILGVITSTSAIATDNTKSKDPKDNGTQLPEVIVTAQKIRQPIQQVPASIDTLDSSFIKRTASNNFSNLQYYLGNVTMQISPSSAQFEIRGFGTQNMNDGFDPAVGTVIDGVFYNRSNFLSAFFYDIDNFTVLRGPQGTLFGKDTTAGLFDLTTARPQPRYLFRWETEYNDYGNLVYKPVLQAPIGQTMSVRISGKFQHGDRGVLYNTFLNRPERNPAQDAWRIRFNYTPNDTWQLDLEAFEALSRQNYNLFQLIHVQPAMRSLILQYDPRADFVPDHLTSENVPSLEVVDVRGINMTTRLHLAHPWNGGSATITSITSMAQTRNDQVDLDADFSPVPFIRNSLTVPSPYRQFSQEFRVTGHAEDFFGLGDGFNFISGIYFSHSAFSEADLFAIQNLAAAAAFIAAANIDNNGLPAASTLGGLVGGSAPTLGTLLNLLSPITGPVIGSKQQANTVLDQRTDSWAWYAQAQQYFLPHWALIAGLRFGWERKLGFASSQSQGQIIGPASGGEVQPFSQNLHLFENNFSPKLGFKWKPNEKSSAYLTWTRGFKSGGFNALPLNNSNLEYGPEQVSSFELGAKTRTRFLNGPLQASAALFWSRFSNLQVSTLVGVNFKILNAAAARSRGFEGSIRWLPPIPRTSLYFSFGYTDAIYTNYKNAPAPSSSGQTTQDLTGKSLAFAPKVSLAFVPSYVVPLPHYVDARCFLAVLYRSKQYLDITDGPYTEQPATTLLNAGVQFNDGTGLWSLTLTGNNLTNVLVLDQVVNQPFANGNFAAVRSNYGRVFAANLTFNFR